MMTHSPISVFLRDALATVSRGRPSLLTLEPYARPTIDDEQRSALYDYVSGAGNFLGCKLATTEG
jgi:hypothetical protein